MVQPLVAGFLPRVGHATASQAAATTAVAVQATLASSFTRSSSTHPLASTVAAAAAAAHTAAAIQRILSDSKLLLYAPVANSRAGDDARHGTCSFLLNPLQAPDAASAVPRSAATANLPISGTTSSRHPPPAACLARIPSHYAAAATCGMRSLSAPHQLPAATCRSPAVAAVPGDGSSSNRTFSSTGSSQATSDAEQQQEPQMLQGRCWGTLRCS